MSQKATGPSDASSLQARTKLLRPVLTSGGSARGPHRQEIDEEGGGAAMGDGSRCAGLASQPGKGLRSLVYATGKRLGMERRACELVVYAAELCQGNVHAIPVWFAVIGDTIYAPKSSHGARAERG